MRWPTNKDLSIFSKEYLEVEYNKLTYIEDHTDNNSIIYIKKIKAKELSLIERVIRVEEELKALKEIEKARFESMETRFEAIDTRFEAMEKRFTTLQWFIGIGFTVISILIAVFGLFVGK